MNEIHGIYCAEGLPAIVSSGIPASEGALMGTTELDEAEDHRDLVTVMASEPADEEMLGMIDGWFRNRGEVSPLGQNWLANRCEDGVRFAPGEEELLLLTPEVGIAPGDIVDCSETVQLGQTLPLPEEDALPATIALATELAEAGGILVTTVAPAAPGVALFSMDDSRAFPPLISAFGLVSPENAARSVSSDSANGLIGLQVSSDRMGIAGWCHAEVAMDFSAMVGDFSAFQRASAAGSPIQCRVVDDRYMSVSNRFGAHFEEPFVDGDHEWQWLAPDHFPLEGTDGVHSIRIASTHPLVAETALEVATNRDVRSVSLLLSEDDQLVVGTAEPARIPGPGFMASRGERNVPFEVPRLIAWLALKVTGQGSTVDLVFDQRFGLLTSTSPSMRIEWLRGQ